MSETSYKLSVANHPAQKRHPFTGEPMVKDGQPVPMITNQKAIKLDNFIIAYVMLETGKICFIQPVERLGDTIVDDVKALAKEAAAEYGTETEAESMHFVAAPQEDESEIDEE